MRSHWENNYGGAVKALNAVEQRLDGMLKDKELPAYVYGDLKREELVRTGSVVLHEHYFANLGGDGKTSGGALELVTRAFGSLETWEADFRRTAGALAGGSGWVVLAFNLHTGEAHNYWAWDHMHNAFWGPRSWCWTCTSTRTTWTSAPPPPATSTPSWTTSTGTRSAGGPSGRRRPSAVEAGGQREPRGAPGRAASAWLDRRACPWLRSRPRGRSARACAREGSGPFRESTACSTSPSGARLRPARIWSWWSRGGDRPRGRGTLKVLAGPKAIVFGYRCEDPDPPGL